MPDQFARQDEALLGACFGGKLGEVQRLLDDEVGVNTKNPMGLAPLHMAVMAGHAQVVAYLLDRAAEIEAKDDQGRTALHVACQEGDEETFAVLMAKKANIDARTNVGKTPLQLACFHDEKDIVRYLLEGGADVHAVDADGQSVLDDPEPDPDIDAILKEHVSRQRVIVAQHTAQPTLTCSGGVAFESGEASVGDKIIVPRKYKPADNEDKSVEPANVTSTVEAAVPYDGSSIPGSVQAGSGNTAPVVPAAASYRGAQGGVVASHPLLQDLEPCDIFGRPLSNNPSVQMASLQSDNCEVEVKGQPSLPGTREETAVVSEAALDRIMAQLGSNML